MSSRKKLGAVKNETLFSDDYTKHADRNVTKLII